MKNLIKKILIESTNNERLLRFVEKLENKFGKNFILKYGYDKKLDELGVDIEYGDYIGYYEKENRVRYYVVNNDGRVVSDNKHTYAGYKPFYRTINASPVGPNEFNGL